MSENTRSRILLVGLVMATAMSSGALLPQTAYVAPEFSMTAQDDTRYTQEAAEQTPRELEDGARPPVDEAVTRGEILARAKHWVDLAIPYDNNTNFETYRKDCSGFVSMAWKLRDNRTTRTLDGVAHDVSKEQLLPGDALLWVNPNAAKMGHVRIFGGWLDAAKSRFWVYEQTPPKAVYREHTWASSVANGYRPIRYDNGIEGENTLGTMLHEARNADGSWTGLAPLNGVGTGAPAKARKVSIAGALDGTAQVAIVGWDNGVYHQVRNADGSWTGFASLGAAAKDVAVTAGATDGSSQVLIAGSDDGVYHEMRNADGSWTGFAPLAGFDAPAKGKKVSIAGALDGSAQVAIIGF